MYAGPQGTLPDPHEALAFRLRHRAVDLQSRCPTGGYRDYGGPIRRKFFDCRAFPSEMNCSIADTQAELVDAAVQHAVAVHGHQDSPELRDQLQGAIPDGMPSEAAPGRAG